MIVAGLGMGLLQPVYTIAVQNVAPRRQMGAATSSTIFFRSIGSTVGVAAFGSIMLTRYHREFAQSMPAHVPAAALPYFSNPLLLVQIRPQLEAAFGRVPGGLALLQTLFTNVKTSLTQRPAPDLRLERDHHGRCRSRCTCCCGASRCARASSSRSWRRRDPSPGSNHPRVAGGSMTCRIGRWLSLTLVCAVGIAAGAAETPPSWTDDLAADCPA